jgi:hypothetical protein
MFFDALHIPWEYEPQGFDVDGRAYLPDFLLGLGKLLWAEVKPTVGADPDGESRFRSFIASQPPGTRGALLTAPQGGRQDFTVIGAQADGDYWEDQRPWAGCPWGYHYDLQRWGSPQDDSGRACSQCDRDPALPPFCWNDDPKIGLAYRKARSARFGR